MNKLGGRIKSLRESNNIQQKVLAKAIGISNVVLSRYETRERRPDYDTLKLIANYFNVTTDYLLGRTDKKRSDWNDKLPELRARDEKDIAKKLQDMINELESGTSLAFDGEPMDEDTRELVLAQIERNLRLTKQHAKQKFTPKKYRDVED